jgi:hypothetical protein
VRSQKWPRATVLLPNAFGALVYGSPRRFVNAHDGIHLHKATKVYRRQGGGAEQLTPFTVMLVGFERSIVICRARARPSRNLLFILLLKRNI